MQQAVDGKHGSYKPAKVRLEPLYKALLNY